MQRTQQRIKNTGQHAKKQNKNVPVQRTHNAKIFCIVRKYNAYALKKCAIIRALHKLVQQRN